MNTNVIKYLKIKWNINNFVNRALYDRVQSTFQHKGKFNI